MRKIFGYLALLFLLLTPLYGNAKESWTFEVKGESIKNELVSHGAYLENSKITVVNTSGKAIFLEWETVSNSFPALWDCSMCQHGKCQVDIPKGSVFKKLNAGEEGFIAIHILPQDISGSGCVKFKIYDKEHPANFKILTFNVQVL